MLKGLPGSHKSSWALEQVSHKDTKVIRLNKDLMRDLFHGGVWSKANEQFVVNARNTLINFALNSGFNVIVDDTNLAPIHESELRKIASQHKDTTFEIKSFTDVPLEQCIADDLKRLKSVGKDVIMGMYDKYLKPKPSVIEYNPALQDCIVCDIDGTVAHNDGHRGYFEWDKVGGDKPIKHIIELIQKLDNPYTHIIYVSGRDEVCREQTAKWLGDNIRMNYPSLFMRPKGDQRDDRIVKEEIYRTKIEGKYNVKYWLDDRPKVIRHMRSLGIKIIDVGEGVDF